MSLLDFEMRVLLVNDFWKEILNVYSHRFYLRFKRYGLSFSGSELRLMLRMEL